MSGIAASAVTLAARRQPATAVAWEAPDVRRRLQLALAALWLLDAVLQYQSFMFTKAFGQMLGGTARGNPHVIAAPITWTAALVGQHVVVLNTIFATVQLAIAIGIAFRPTVKLALAGSVLWALAVWWLGEGLGGILSGTASPVNGAPGAVVIYALIAVLLWPAEQDPAARSIAARTVGPQVARAIWVAFWASGVYFTVQSSNLTASRLPDLISSNAQGEPSWLASLEHNAASLLGHDGVAASIVLAALLAVIAGSVFLPPAAARIAIAGTIVLATVIWVVGEAFGGILTGTSTDPNSGPLLALLALLFWPQARTVT
jgi:hypothetical protein